MSKTNFSFELQYASDSPITQDQRDKVMTTLESSLKAMLNVHDAAAIVTLSNSHKGNDNKILEFVTRLSDPQIAEILQTFCDQHGVKVSALE
jgi:hypothetical protein